MCFGRKNGAGIGVCLFAEMWGDSLQGRARVCCKVAELQCYAVMGAGSMVVWGSQVIQAVRGCR